VNKNNSKKTPTTTEDLIARGGFMISKMRPDTVALIETTVGVLYTLRLVDPITNLIHFTSTDEGMRQSGPQPCHFSSSWTDRTGRIAIRDWVIKDCMFLLKFKHEGWLSHPVRSCLLEAPNWKYEVISP